MYGIVNHCPRWSLCSMIIRTYQSPAATSSSGTPGRACSRPTFSSAPTNTSASSNPSTYTWSHNVLRPMGPPSVMLTTSGRTP